MRVRVARTDRPPPARARLAARWSGCDAAIRRQMISGVCITTRCGRACRMIRLMSRRAAPGSESTLRPGNPGSASSKTPTSAAAASCSARRMPGMSVSGHRIEAAGVAVGDDAVRDLDARLRPEGHRSREPKSTSSGWATTTSTRSTRFWPSRIVIAHPAILETLPRTRRPSACSTAVACARSSVCGSPRRRVHALRRPSVVGDRSRRGRRRRERRNDTIASLLEGSGTHPSETPSSTRAARC